jgi:hypothetical protein
MACGRLILMPSLVNRTTLKYQDFEKSKLFAPSRYMLMSTISEGRDYPEALFAALSGVVRNMSPGRKGEEQIKSLISGA